MTTKEKTNGATKRFRWTVVAGSLKEALKKIKTVAPVPSAQLYGGGAITVVAGSRKAAIEKARIALKAGNVDDTQNRRFRDDLLANLDDYMEMIDDDVDDVDDVEEQVRGVSINWPTSTR